jgi:hypothetical protein
MLRVSAKLDVSIFKFKSFKKGFKINFLYINKAIIKNRIYEIVYSSSKSNTETHLTFNVNNTFMNLSDFKIVENHAEFY